ncbi:3-dehydroquinate synthase [Draconibacterium halophilum]|uniref:3-dehydroquinate synthase n=1 Tax=Draconibacterium halophilum TaxID=2706887 RepID=A0A6C0RI77_9BACT|nr:3-dehydroquinate synthase [Draconibacterium halophilum]QIA09542.1 3-dehydroquinate synthase [Draconibacterium halophilum]
MGNSKIYSKIIYSRKLQQELQAYIDKYPKGKVFLATEETVDQLWVAKIDSFLTSNGIKKVVVPAGENNKKITSVETIWQFLSENEGDRKSLLINIGGGMLTDLAGFAASTFKRGIDFLNVPTTLLSQVDASVGGKTGFNFNGLKNEIGVFKEPVAVVINTDFLKTIDRNNFISGFAEMIKHGLIHSPDHLAELKDFNFDTIDYDLLQEVIRHSVNVKEYFVANDLTENNIRKALNFGHTVGHAFESLAMSRNRPVLHGYAVAYAMIAELFLSVKMCGLPQQDCDKWTKWMLDIYGKFEIADNDFEQLYQLMTHDKKNDSGRINFTLLPKVGEIAINQNCSKDLILEALNYYKSL